MSFHSCQPPARSLQLSNQIQEQPNQRGRQLFRKHSQILFLRGKLVWNYLYSNSKTQYSMFNASSSRPLSRAMYASLELGIYAVLYLVEVTTLAIIGFSSMFGAAMFVHGSGSHGNSDSLSPVNP